MLARLTTALLVSFVFVSAASAANTYAEGAKEIQDMLRVRAQQSCPAAKDSASCFAAFMVAGELADTVQVRYAASMKAADDGHGELARELRWEFRAYYDLLERERMHLINTYK
jgi:hypothetical protein